MTWVYLIAGVAIFIKMLVVPTLAVDAPEISIVEIVSQESGVPNAVSGIIFRNRLYDTIFEVVVFTLSIMGVRFLLANEMPPQKIYRFTDHPSIVLARLGAIIAAMVSIELAIRGHLSPGGGFAAGVAGGTAIGLVAITSSSEQMEAIYRRWHAATLEKVSVLIFIVLAGIVLADIPSTTAALNGFIQFGTIPLFNILVALKVALGSWAVILMFIRYRGLL